MAFDYKKVLAVAKKRVGLIVCCALLAGAMVVPFYPVAGMVESYKNDLSSASSRMGEVESMLGKTRRLPSLDPRVTEEMPLEGFPTEAAIEAASKAKEVLESQVEAMVKAAESINVRRPLINSFPAPTPVDRFAFRNNIVTAYQRTLPGIMKATMPVTTDQVQAELEKVRAEEIAQAQGDRNTPIPPVVMAQIDRRMQELQSSLPVTLPEKLAREHSVYIEPARDMQNNPRGYSDSFHKEQKILEGTGAPDVNEIWLAQVRLWVQEDVARAIAATNGSSTSVIDSAVKRLKLISFPQELSMFVFPGGQRPQQGQAIAGMATDPSAAVPSESAISYTGRVSNGLFDVVHFSLIVHVRETDVARFVSQISRNRLMTVLKLDITPVDPSTLQQPLYVYGPGAVVEVKMDVEALFLRSWTAPLMPESVKLLLGISGAAAPG